MMRKSERRGVVGSRRRRAGETLTETVMAILIIGLASVLFLTMVGVSGRIFHRAEEEYKKVYELITSADTRKDPAAEADKMIVEGTKSVEVEVEWYGKAREDGTDYVLSYEAS